MLLAVMVVLGVGCGSRRVVVAKTPEGAACQRQCTQFFNDCYQGKRKNRKFCTQRERECLLGCPGGHEFDELYDSGNRAPVESSPAEVAPVDGGVSCVASESPEWAGASAVRKKELLDACR